MLMSLSKVTVKAMYPFGAVGGGASVDGAGDCPEEVDETGVVWTGDGLDDVDVGDTVDGASAVVDPAGTAVVSTAPVDVGGAAVGVPGLAVDGVAGMAVEG